MIKINEAIILAGGLGTRLAHEIPNICKPMAPICGQPFLKILLNKLKTNEINNVVIADGYRREIIENYFGKEFNDLKIKYSSETTPLHTGGAVKKAMKLCGNEFVLVMNGDSYVDFDLQRFIGKNQDKFYKADVFMLTKKIDNCDRYGFVDVDDNGVVVNFIEKGRVNGGVINTGVYLIRKEAILTYPETVFSLEYDFFNALLHKRKIMASETNGLFIDIGIPQDYKRAQMILHEIVVN